MVCRFFSAVLIISALVVSQSGCSDSSRTPTASAPLAPPHGVAVIDLDAVAQRLGSDAVMNQSLQTAAATLDQNFATIQATYQTQFDTAKTELGETPTTEQTQQLANFGKEINLKLNQTRQTAQSQLTQHRSQLIQRFRDQVKPIAQAVASQRGLDVVVSKNDTVIFAFGPTADITDEVIETLLAQTSAGSKTPATPSPTAPSPTASSPPARLPTSATQTPTRTAGRRATEPPPQR
ncbi:MAG: OmpH family outer membrane protein [Pirellulales bacterium]|nr:OmpH family outer membrane protein [Pirellulales bacterium]